MRIFLATLIAFCTIQTVQAQKFISSSSEITFFSSAPLEDIEAVNSKARSVFDDSNGEVVFTVPINEFQFDKSLMQEHFNEKYMESEKYPRATFRGKIESHTAGQSKAQAWASGEMEIHGVKKQIRVPGSVQFKDGKVVIESTFMVKLEDYDVKIPKLMFQNIAEEVEVKVKFEYKPYGT